MTGDLDAILAAIDGALADDELPDAMRWSPEPETVDDARAPFDGETVWVGPEERSSTYDREHDYDPALPIGPQNFPLASTRRGGVRFPRPPLEWTPVPEPEPEPAPAPRPARGYTPDLLILDETFLVDPAYRDEVRAEQEEQRREVAVRLGFALDVPPERIAPPARVEVPPGLLRTVPLLRPLSLPEATRLALQAEQSAEEYERNLQALREAFAPAAEQLAALVESLRRIAADAGLRFAELVGAIGKAANAYAPIPPPRRLRDEDPRAYALALRQARGTGPDRQVQHRPRPRRHP